MAVVDAGELAGRLEEMRLVDARGSGYEDGHLPGAVHADLERDLSAAGTVPPERGGRHPLPPPGDFARTLGRWGITPETDVVIYDDKGGANAASRLWWMLRAFGHERVAVLDGGMQAAVDAGIEPTRAEPEVEPAPPYPAGEYALPTTDIGGVARRANDPGWVVLDVREGARFRGETEPLDPVAGHIPGARNLFFGDNLDARGRFEAPEKLRAMYEQLLGDVPPERLVVSCGSGVTACHTLLALERAGLRGASLYVGSWSEWCRDPSRPREP